MTTPPPGPGYPGQPQSQPPGQPQGPPPGQAFGQHGQPPQQAPGQAAGQPGYGPYAPGPPPGYGPPPSPRPPADRTTVLVWVLGLVSLVAVLIGLSVKEDGANAWSSVNAWGALAILGAVLTLTPAVGHAVGLTRRRAQQSAACGAGALVLFWVLFTLPSVGSNTSLAVTVGVAAGVIAAWVSANPANPGSTPGAPHQW